MAADAFDELLTVFNDYFDDDSGNGGAPVALTSRDTTSLNAFEELLCVIGPYIDDLDDSPAFHRFAELPPELRYKVYEQYFIDNNKCLACLKWPDSNGKPSLSFTKPRGPRWGRPSPFLPNLCPVDHTLRTEVTSALVGPMILPLDETLSTELMSHKGISTFVLCMVRKPIFMDINKDLSTPGKDDIIMRNRILSASSNLRKLHFVSVIAVPAKNDLSSRMGIIEDGL